MSFELLPDVERGYTWTEDHKLRCMIRQLLRYRAQGNRKALEALQRSRSYSQWRALATEQWSKGNRGEPGDWR